MYNRCQWKPLFKRIHFTHARTATLLRHLQHETDRPANVAVGNSSLQAKIVLTCDYGYGYRYSQHSCYHGHGVCSSEMYLAILLKSFVSISKHTVVTGFLEGQLKCDGTRAETRFRLSAKRTSPFKSAGGRQFSRLLAAEVCVSAVVMLDTPCSEVVWRCTGYPLHSPVFPSLPFPCVTVWDHISTGVKLQIHDHAQFHRSAFK